MPATPLSSDPFRRGPSEDAHALDVQGLTDERHVPLTGTVVPANLQAPGPVARPAHACRHVQWRQ